jgi:uncharacterized membrane protein
MGDKTQLATIALAAKFPGSPMGILMGTTAGMLVADGLGIILGIVLRKKIPEQKIKFISAGAFMLFGFIGTFEVLKNDFSLALPLVICILVTLMAAATLAALFIIRKNKNDKFTP